MKLLKKIHFVKLFLVLLFIVVLAMIPFMQKEQAEIESVSVWDDTTSHNSEPLRREIDAILADPRLQGATTGISILNATSGEVIYSHLGDARVHPASVMKLLTGAAALEVLGEDYTFKTELYTDGVIRNGVLEGNIYLRGQGDPTLTKADLTGFISDLKAKGIKTINGNVYGDDTWYDDVRLSQDLNWSDESYYTGAQISALTFSPNDDYDAGTVIVEVSPAPKKGQAGTIGMVPENDYMEIVNKTQTVAKKGEKRLSIERVHGTNTIVVSGTIPEKSKKTKSWVAVWEPTDYAIILFKSLIEEHGITFSIKPKIGRATVPDSATLLMTKQSIPLEELFIPFLKLSNNGHGEVLVKEMGRVVGGEGSWHKGLAVTADTLLDMGIDTKTMLLRDGSGMSHKNLVTANEVTKLLFVAQTKPWFPTFLSSLPIAGHDDRFVGGTLRNRLKGTVAEGKVKAKTGLLNGVTTLSGYVETKDGETFIFSVMVNNHLDNTVSEVIDQITVLLANYTSNIKS